MVFEDLLAAGYQAAILHDLRIHPCPSGIADVRLDRRPGGELAAADERALADPAPQIFVDALADSAVVLRLRVWTATSNYWPLTRALTERGKASLEAAGLSIPFPQTDMHIKGGPPIETGLVLRL